MKYVMSVETVKIKEFIFSTNKMKVMEGASFLLDYLNQVELPKILSENSINEENRVYIGAGNAKFFVENKDEAEKIGKKIKELYEKTAPEAKIVYAYEEKKDNDKIWDILDKLGEKIAIEKSRGFETLNIDLPFFEKCELSGNELAEVSAENLENDLEKLNILIENEKEIKTLKAQIKNYAKKTNKISETTLRKIIYANKITNKNFKEEDNFSFYNLLLNKLEIKNLEKEELKRRIDEEASEDSFIGVMYSDGDSLGDFLKNIKKNFMNKKENYQKVEEDYLKFMKNFSETLDNNTKYSLLEAVEEVFNSIKDIEEQQKNSKFMGKFLIVGGDDVCAIFHPSLVLKISELFQQKFENKMKNFKNGLEEYGINPNEVEGITSSSGVIIAKQKTPMFQLVEQALILQKKAKKERYQLKKQLKEISTGFIDFEVIGSEGCVNINKFREEISKENNKTIQRPYTINFDNQKNISELIEQIESLKKENFPKTKLRYFYDLKQDKKKIEEEKKWEFMDKLSKMDKKHIKLILDWLEKDYLEKSFNEYFENIFDILELYDFVGGGENENKL